MGETFEPTEHTRIRYEKRASYDRDLAYSIIDEATVAHVGLVSRGRPVVIPMLHARLEDRLYLHGSPATRLMRATKPGIDICVSITLLDGLVLARSAMHHSANYRSVVVFGTSEPVTSVDDRRAVLDAYTDKLVPGRRTLLRPMSDLDVRGTAMISIPIEETSVKVRSGGPIDEDEDYELPIWAGVLSAAKGWADVEADPRNLPGVEMPDHVAEMLR